MLFPRRGGSRPADGSCERLRRLPVPNREARVGEGPDIAVVGAAGELEEAERLGVPLEREGEVGVGALGIPASDVLAEEPPIEIARRRFRGGGRALAFQPVEAAVVEVVLQDGGKDWLGLDGP